MDKPNFQKRKMPKGKTPKACNHQTFDTLGILDGNKTYKTSQPKTLSQLADELEQTLLKYEEMVKKLLTWEYFSLPLFWR